MTKLLPILLFNPSSHNCFTAVVVAEEDQSTKLQNHIDIFPHHALCNIRRSVSGIGPLPCIFKLISMQCCNLSLETILPIASIITSTPNREISPQNPGNRLRKPKANLNPLSVQGNNHLKQTSSLRRRLRPSHINHCHVSDRYLEN